MLNGTNPTPPIDFPKITVDGVVYVVRFTLLAEYVLGTLGMTVGESLEAISKKAGPIVAVAMKLIAACTADNFMDRGQPAQTPEWWAMTLQRTGQWKEMNQALGEAIKKAFPPAPRLQEQATEITESSTNVQ